MKTSMHPRVHVRVCMCARACACVCVCADFGDPSLCFASTLTSTWTPDLCLFRLLSYYLSFKVQLACRLLQEGSVGTEDTGINTINRVVALPSVP